MQERQVRRADLDEVDWIIELSARVQAALTASGSPQHIGPLPRQSVRESVAARNAYVLETADGRLGSVLVEPLPGDSSSITRWGLPTLPGPCWYLHALMLEPGKQGQRLGLDFLEGVKRLVLPSTGTIILDCWAGNAKLRDFYHRAGFAFHGVFPENDYEVAVFLFSR